MEIHLMKINKNFHLFELIREARLRSYCGIDGIANYSDSNKFNIFHDEGDLLDRLDSISDAVCPICELKSKVLEKKF